MIGVERVEDHYSFEDVAAGWIRMHKWEVLLKKKNATKWREEHVGEDVG